MQSEPPASSASASKSSGESSGVPSTACRHVVSGMESSCEASENMDNENHPSIIQELKTPVVVPGPVDSPYPSWAAWTAYLKDYALQTRQIIRVFGTLSCVLRNKRLANTVAAKKGLDVPYVPED
ncbi:uncharacterized protein PITG_10665 [Phytophthora infestans T30-4]|uniref:Uncharacterized protein n=1 Tax=Phytophthora infestans (strain T30-4) TaxID=403677 RepID=D0NGT3_PHYIT|nr:uncharacterized protein PITG_10665 [Phytophthora infestans T30-4]EEY58572.1 conserved hypothetical protein [Phytophthora infestans T30-4]|eukprot:XP_002901516.1 conserved hypothetical protein [Phytophthora infestans T30-4]